MLTNANRFRSIILCALICLGAASACNNDDKPSVNPTSHNLPATPANEETSSPPGNIEILPTPILTSTPQNTASLLPSPTPQPPMVARVNQQPIYKERFEREVNRYLVGQQALGISANANDLEIRQIVLDQMIDQALIAEKANTLGFTVSAQTVTEQIESLKAEVGGEENLATWLKNNEFTAAEFALSLSEMMLSQQVYENITADVPYAVEQVRASYIQVDDPTLAATIVEQARASAPFAQLAQLYSLDRHTGENGGDLGFFPRNWLFVPEIEQAAFALQVGEISDPIAVPHADGSGSAYYIVQVTEIDSQRRLSEQQRNALLTQTFQTWLDEQRAAAVVETITP